jgi:hypothetical protein
MRMKQEFQRPDIPLETRREQQAAEAPVAMADYRRAYDRKLERMIELKHIRLAQQRTKSNGQQ